MKAKREITISEAIKKGIPPCDFMVFEPSSINEFGGGKWVFRAFKDSK
jgi:hypothetical protein